jgi:prephenate dehydrogenase
MNKAKILVHGAGPLGSLFAGRLHEAGYRVSLLARGQRLDDLQEHGVMRAAGRDNVHKARTRDLVMLTVRAIREGFQMLRALGVLVTPDTIKRFELILPRPHHSRFANDLCPLHR